ncbi:MAG: hypothetical protein WCB14_21375 [Candidatus Acidiferrales bacterium]
MNNVSPQFHEISALKWALERQQLIQRYSQGPNVGALVGAARSGQKLRSHIGRRADHQARVRHGEILLFGQIHQAGNSKIDDLDDHFVSIVVQHDVCGLDIAVKEAAAMRVTQRVASGDDVSQAHGERTSLSFSDDAIKASAVHIFHDDEVNAIGLICIVDLNDVLML